MTATSTEQRTDSSCAFLNRPPLRFRKVLSHGISIASSAKIANGVCVERLGAKIGDSVQGPPVHEGRSGLAYFSLRMEINSEYSHRAVPIVLDGLDFDFPSTHCCDFSILFCRRRQVKTRLARPESVGVGGLERKWRVSRWQWTQDAFGSWSLKRDRGGDEDYGGDNDSQKWDHNPAYIVSSMYIDIQRGLRDVLNLNRRRQTFHFSIQRGNPSGPPREMQANYGPILNPANDINRFLCDQMALNLLKRLTVHVCSL